MSIQGNPSFYEQSCSQGIFKDMKNVYDIVSEKNPNFALKSIYVTTRTYCIAQGTIFNIL